MTAEELDKLIWDSIQPAANYKQPEESDGYNEAEVYASCMKACNKLVQLEEYKQMKKKAAKWDKVQEVLQGAKLELRYSDGKTIELISEEK